MATIKLYFDEDVTDGLTRVLRARGFDALSVYDANLKGKTDLEQLEFAVSQHRAIFTFNVKHFC